MTDETMELTAFSDSMNAAEKTGSGTEVGDIAPIYTTLPGDPHPHYKGKEVKFPGSQTSASSPLSTEYDLVKELDGSTRGSTFVSQGSIRRHAENALYLDTKTAEDEFRHATLQLDGTHAIPQSYHGAASTSVQEPDIKYTSCNFKPKDKLLCAFIFLTLLVAVAALALVLILWFGVYKPPCNCGTGDTDTEDLQRQISDLRQQLESAVAGNVSQLRANISDLQDSFEGGFQTDVPFVANLMGVELFENCSTTVEAMCTIPLGSMEAGFSICDTSPIDINSNDLLEAHCAVTDTNGESNPIVTTLLVDRDLEKMLCLCWVVVPGNIAQSQLVTCGLFVTRCPPIQNLIFNGTTF